MPRHLACRLSRRTTQITKRNPLPIALGGEQSQLDLDFLGARSSPTQVRPRAHPPLVQRDLDAFAQPTVRCVESTYFLRAFEVRSWTCFVLLTCLSAKKYATKCDRARRT